MSSRKDDPKRLAPVTPADPTDDWRLLIAGTSGEAGDLVPFRLEMRGDRTALRYAVQIEGEWHRKVHELDATFARFIEAVRATAAQDR